MLTGKTQILNPLYGKHILLSFINKQKKTTEKKVYFSDDVFYDAVHVQCICTHKYRHGILCERHR